MNRPKAPVKPPPAFVIQRKSVTTLPVVVVQAKAAAKGPAPFLIQAKPRLKEVQHVMQTKVGVNVPPVYRPMAGKTLQAKVVASKLSAPVIHEVLAPPAPAVFHAAARTLPQAQLGARMSAMAVGMAPIQMASQGNPEKRAKQEAKKAAVDRREERDIASTVRNAGRYGGVEASVARRAAKSGVKVKGHSSRNSNAKMNNASKQGMVKMHAFARDEREDDGGGSSSEDEQPVRQSTAAAAAPVFIDAEELIIAAAKVWNAAVGNPNVGQNPLAKVTQYINGRKLHDPSLKAIVAEEALEAFAEWPEEQKFPI